MKLRKAGLTAKLSKCHFSMNECQFLDDAVGDGQIHPEDAKVAVVHQFRQPNRRKKYEHSWNWQDILENLFLTLLKLQFHSQ